MKRIILSIIVISLVFSCVGCKTNVTDKSIGNENESISMGVSNLTDDIDWRAFCVKINGKTITLPCHLSDLEATGLRVECEYSTWSECSATCYWFAFDEKLGYKKGNLNGTINYDPSTEQPEEKIITTVGTFVNYYEEVPIDMTLPGDIMWGKSDVNDALAVWGTANDTSDAPADGSTPLEKYYWYVDPEIGESSGSLTIGSYADTGTIGYVRIACPSALLAQSVRLAGSDAWADSVTANIGDEIEFQIEYTNQQSDIAEDVMIRDLLPSGVEYINDSTWLYNSNYENGVQLADNTVTTSGINIGSYTQCGNAYVRFKCRVSDKLPAGSVNSVSVTVDETVVSIKSVDIKSS